ncbi:MAG TPA: J domain-containing protein [Kofleriaceae bacterium]|nr:J domain-containing protein [Kofleriaceae bacterium]
MSVTRRIVEGARTGLSSLFDKISADETPLSGIEREELDAELERRVKAREAAGQAAGQAAGEATGQARRPEDNPRARWAGAGEAATKQRRQAAESRESRIRAGRAATRKAEEAAREEAWQRLQSEARRQAPSSGGASSSGAGARPGSTGPAGAGAGSRPGGGASAGPRPGAGRPGGAGPNSSGGRRPGGFGGRQDKIGKYYNVLDLPYGASFEQVKASYRKLMRKYHPDLHHQTPQKAKAATELTMQVTEAYNELERYLIGDPSKKT